MELLLPKGRRLGLDRPVMVGVLNVTPDSFSDGGRYEEEEAAAARAGEMVKEGAGVIDVGGESTRPGARAVGAEEQIRRVVGVVGRVAGMAAGVLPGDKRGRAVVSIDTYLPEVAEAAIDAGAEVVNDVCAGLVMGTERESGMLGLAAERGCAVVLMHMRGEPGTMQDGPVYGDVVEEVYGFLMRRAEAAEKAGLRREQVVIDPGIGFGKTVEHNLKLMAGLGRLVGSGYAVMLGASRKRFLRAVCGVGGEGGRLLSGELVGATCATTAVGVMAGVRMFRVHDVAENVRAAEVAWGVRRGFGPGV